jgi:FlaA1/EpsC-like NDP-sugar epimerase
VEINIHIFVDALNSLYMFKKIAIVPRSLIFSIDIVLSIISLVFGKVLKNNFILSQINVLALYRSILFLFFVNLIVFASVRIYAGIVRYTSAQDSMRILVAVVLSSFFIFLVNAAAVSLGYMPFISMTTVIMYALFCFSSLISYRFLVKFFFIYIKNLKLDKVRVIIYGAGEAGMATKRTFDHDQQFNKNILAFVDDDERKVGKMIDGIRILDARNLEKLIVEHEVDEIIFASYTIPLERKNLIVDVCLENDVKALSIPDHDVWAKGNVRAASIHNINIEDLLDRKQIKMNLDSIQKELKNKRILITGAAGSIGSEIVRQLMKFETSLVIMCDQSETGLHHLELELEEKYKHLNFHAFIGDVKDMNRMEFLFSHFKPHYVYHAAAYKHVPMMEDNPAEAIKTNVSGTKTIADLSVKHGVLKFVMISTDKAVNPTNIMGASKRIAEIYVQSLNNLKDHRTKFITTRFGNVLGSNGSVIPRFKEQIEKGGPVTVTHPEITRYFMTIPEACRLVLEAGNMGAGGEIFIFDMGKSVKIIELANKMIRLAGLVPNKDIAISFSGLRPGEKLYEELLNDNENVMPTHHEKIMIGKVREYVFEEVQQQISNLLAFAITNDNTKVVMQMKTIVPEFKSKNSKFEALDSLLESLVAE